MVAMPGAPDGVEGSIGFAAAAMQETKKVPGVSGGVERQAAT